MTTLADSFKEQFHKLLEAEYVKIVDRDTLQKARIKSWDHYQALGLPSRRVEVYRYVKLRKLYSQPFSTIEKKIVDRSLITPHILPGYEQSLLVCINGHFYPELSSLQALPENVVFLPLDQAVRNYGTFLNNHLSKSLKVEKDPFVALNGALQGGGAFLYLPPNTISKKGIQILNLIDIDKFPTFVTPRLHIFAGKQSQVDIVATNKCISGEHFISNQYVDFTLEEGAQVIFNQITLGNPPNAWIFDAVRASLKRDSLFRSVAITDGAATVRNDYRVELTGENGEVSLNGLWMLKDSKEAHTNVFIEHQAPHCRSMQLFKGALNHSSSSSFEGKIFVKQAAQKTEAFQLNNNLLLSDKAHADSKPNLEIFADDVKASHGATVGQLEAEQLFYLRARGYTNEMAKSILVKGFCLEVLDLIHDSALQEELKTKIQDCLF